MFLLPFAFNVCCFIIRCFIFFKYNTQEFYFNRYLYNLYCAFAHIHFFYFYNFLLFFLKYSIISFIFSIFLQIQYLFFVYLHQKELFMSITLNALIQETAQNCALHLAAGEKGLVNIVSWIHIIEDESITAFLLGGELIFTTGIRQNDSGWILPFCKALKKAGSSGLVLNIGPYIPEVPNPVIEFCNEESFPLFTTPWESRLVQITQTFGYLIMENESTETSISNAFKDMIFKPSYYEYCVSSLRQHGYSSSDKYSIAVLLTSESHSALDSALKKKITFRTELILKRDCPHNSFAFFWLPNQLVLILTQKATPFLRDILSQLNRTLQAELGIKVHAGTGQIEEPLSHLRDSYSLALKVAELARKLKTPGLFYDELGVYKLLMLHSQEKVISDFYQNTLKDLAEYDRCNHTDYLEFLDKYISCGFSIHALAESAFLHRNTVYYKLGKIESILGQNLNDWNVRLNLLLCQYIRNLL